MRNHTCKHIKISRNTTWPEVNGKKQKCVETLFAGIFSMQLELVLLTFFGYTTCKKTFNFRSLFNCCFGVSFFALYLFSLIPFSFSALSFSCLFFSFRFVLFLFFNA